MRTWLLSIVFAGLALSAKAQLHPEDVEEASKLRKENPGQEVCGTSLQENYTFKLFSVGSKTTIGAQLKEKSAYISLQPAGTFVASKNHDEQTQVLKAQMYNRYHEKIQFQTYDIPYKEYYVSDTRHWVLLKEILDFSERFSLEAQTIYKDIKYLPTLYFHENYPLQEKTITFTIPAWLKLDLIEMNFEGYNITKEKVVKGSNTIIKYTIRDLKSFNGKGGTPGPSHFLPHLMLIPRTYKQMGKTENYLNTTKDLYKWYAELAAQNKSTEKPWKSTVRQLTEGKTNDIDKIKAIFYWVQDNIDYLAFEQGLAGFRPEEAHKVFNNRYGDCKGMANLTKAMLKEAGYDARLTWIGTNYIAYSYKYPSLAVDNHMICTVILNNKRYFLDGTEKYSEFGHYADRIQGKEVLIENGSSYFIDSIPDAPYDSTQLIVKRNYSIRGNDLIGDAHFEMSNDYKVEFLNIYNSIKSDKKELALFESLSQNKSELIHTIDHSDLYNREGNLYLKSTFTMKDMVMRSGKEAYLTLGYRTQIIKSRFDSTRTLDFAFDKPCLESEEITLDLSGYQVKYLPPPVLFDRKTYRIEASYKQEGNKLVYVCKFHYKETRMRNTEFKIWNQDMDALERFFLDNVILISK